ncbi:MAG: 2-C-methyl-D-erythritol 4-phosphate cytidylyltransferase [Candidatus Omnitrophica bacterium]|nr:2-C-methyl-D-erythritol 4-phosphate cytidylyltransferase [Candidatus Omnitrophota bacterium]
MRTTLILAAGGRSSRFRKSLEDKKSREIPKLSLRSLPSKIFLSLNGKPLLEHSLDVFRPFRNIREIFVAVPPGEETRMQGRIREFKKCPVKIVRGGRTRAESVWNALRKSDPNNEWVMVHDAARPLVSRGSIQKLFQSRKGADGVILAAPVVSTVKEIGAQEFVTRTVDRQMLVEAQTPQLVRRQLLMKAYRENPRALSETDESALLESVGGRVKVVIQEEWNPKVTTVKDLELAEAYLRQGKGMIVRTGFGRDTHRLVPGRKFWIGGIGIPFEKGPFGHSDGDTLLHAISDGILGVLAQGDIGDWFSDKDPNLKDIRSTKLLRKILANASKQGWSLCHVDTVIILERPKLGILKLRIKKKLSRLLNLPPDCVSIKAKTAEGLGPEGQGDAITCEALVTMRKEER